MGIKNFWNGFFHKNNNSAEKPTYHVDSTPLTENEIEEFQQLYDNDFGARNEKVLDYNHSDYIENGINRVDWGEDHSDAPHTETLSPGDVISRYGSDSGKYFGDIGTDFDSRQLPYSEDKVDPKYYEVIKPLPVEQSTIAEQEKWNDVKNIDSSAQQYKTKESEAWLRDNGYIKEISREKADELCPSGKTSISDRRASRNLNDDLNNAELFNENTKGNYNYSEMQYGKIASGNLKLDTGERNSKAQRTVGGDDRRITDDGGHFIGTRFSGDSGQKNMEAQDKNLNRGSYKIRENDWAKSLENGDKVFVNAESFKSNNSDRPDAFMGYSIKEHPDGTREWDAFSYQNESAAVQDDWNQAIAYNDLMDQYDNPIDYDPADYANELSDNDYSDTSNDNGVDQPMGEADVKGESDGEGESEGEDNSEGKDQPEGEDNSEGEDQPEGEDNSEGEDQPEGEDNSEGEDQPEGEDNSEGEDQPEGEDNSEGEDQPEGEDNSEGEDQPEGEDNSEGEDQPEGEDNSEGEDQPEGEDNSEGEDQPEGEDNSGSETSSPDSGGESEGGGYDYGYGY